MKKYKVVKHETITGTTYKMGKYKETVKVSWEVMDKYPLDNSKPYLSGGTFKSKKVSIEVCRLLNEFVNEDNMFLSSHTDYYKAMFKLIGNVNKKTFRKELLDYQESLRVR
jgi:hypothetical protein